MNWSSLNEILKDDEVFNTLLWVSFGFALREQVSTAAYDWSILTGQRRWRWIHFVYFTTKIAYWAAVSTVITLVHAVRRIDCEAVAYLSKTATAFATITSSALLACRAVAVFDRHQHRRTFVILFTVLGLGAAASSFYQISRVDTFWVPGIGKPWTEGACALVAFRPDDIIAPSVTAAFDFIVLMLVIHGIYSLRAEQTAVGKRLLRQHAIYVVIVVLITATSLGFLVARLNPIMRLILSTPLSTVSMLLSTRLHVELAESVSTPTDTSPFPSDSDSKRAAGWSGGLEDVARSGENRDRRKDLDLSATGPSDYDPESLSTDGPTHPHAPPRLLSSGVRRLQIGWLAVESVSREANERPDSDLQTQGSLQDHRGIGSLDPRS
ncbi:hypothetical protein V8E36_006046 [Tilletia maclaganii]